MDRCCKFLKTVLLLFLFNFANIKSSGVESTNRELREKEYLDNRKIIQEDSTKRKEEKEKEKEPKTTNEKRNILNKLFDFERFRKAIAFGESRNIKTSISPSGAYIGLYQIHKNLYLSKIDIQKFISDVSMQDSVFISMCYDTYKGIKNRKIWFGGEEIFVFEVPQKNKSIKFEHIFAMAHGIGLYGMYDVLCERTEFDKKCKYGSDNKIIGNFILKYQKISQ